MLFSFYEKTKNIIVKEFDVLLKNEARNLLVTGANKLAEAVKATLGPGGRTVLIRKENRIVHSTKDGVTVAKTIILNNPIEEMGATIIREAAAMTGKRAGDGTTTSTVIAQYLINEGMVLLKRGFNPVEIKSCWDALAAEVITHLDRNFVDREMTLEKIQSIATVATNNNDFLGKLVGKTIYDIGNNGVVTVEESPTLKTYTDVIRGLQLGSGFVSPYFVNSPKIMAAAYKPAKVLVVNGKIHSTNSIIHILDHCHQNRIPLLIIANDYSDTVVELLEANFMHKNWQGVVVKTPGFEHQKINYLEDVAIVTNAKICDLEHGDSLENIELEHLGVTSRIEVNEMHTTIISALVPGSPAIDRLNIFVERLIQMKEQAQDVLERDFIQSRLNRITGGVAVIYVGAPTVLEAKEIVDRVDDAIQACKSAMAEGILPGGGNMLYREARRLGLNTFYRRKSIRSVFSGALASPIKAIYKNAGYSESLLQDIDHENWHRGLDVKTGETVNLIKKGIVDPFKVIRESLSNAVSVATLFLLTEAVVYRDYPKKDILPPNIVKP